VKITIRQEHEIDYATVNQLTFLAFKNMKFSNGDEHELVAKLRKSENFIPELSLVALHREEIVGHILFTSSHIITVDNELFKSLTLAPVSVHPSWQNQRIGSQLIQDGLSLAKKLGFTNVNVLGHPGFYPKFEFLPASEFEISPPIDVPADSFMILELEKGSLCGIHGTIQYAKEFGI
jgi:predicted N-acetyltransferase YhbS